MKKIYLLILINTFLFGCNKKDPCKNEGISQVRDIKQEILDLVPYKDLSELTFVDSITLDTHVFYGQGWQKSYWYYHDYSDECSVGTNLQKIQQGFFSPTFPKSIFFGMVYVNPGEVYIEVIAEMENIYYLSPGYLLWHRTPQDSINIQNNWYKNYVFFSDHYGKLGRNKNLGCYLNPSHGLLKIQFPETTLELLKFKP